MVKYLILIFLSFMVIGCSSKNMSVSSVTQEFWTAQQQERISVAKKLTVKEDEKKTKLYEKIKIKTAIFEEPKEDGDSAIVPTKLYLKGDDDIKEVEFDTALTKTDNGWRVNMDTTKRNLYLALSKQIAENMSSVLKKGLGGVENIKKIFGDFINEFKDVVEKSKK